MVEEALSAWHVYLSTLTAHPLEEVGAGEVVTSPVRARCLLDVLVMLEGVSLVGVCVREGAEPSHIIAREGRGKYVVFPPSSTREVVRWVRGLSERSPGALPSLRCDERVLLTCVIGAISRGEHVGPLVVPPPAYEGILS